MIPEFEYAIYVWSSYGIFAVVIAWQIVQPVLYRRRLMAELREELALQSGDYNDPNS
ncbi:MAG: heme exporter protein CcmD [Wenzhouxiangella sp.]|nr:heme exporter protein CcmD [Wenzhouxiangella sp.]MCH8476767.1 heme exporter protein CcmD [Wenzhouxiangella sp.]TVR98403.1 MAG: heme exporter protein CcmD [Wenzhouxiangellaceae bacterium]